MSLFKQSLLALLIVLAYFSVWRPGREVWNMRVMRPAIGSILASHAERGSANVRFAENQHSNVSTVLTYTQTKPSDTTLIRYYVSGGLFLLLPLAVLPFVTRRWRDYARLLLFHGAMIVAVSLLLILGLTLAAPFLPLLLVDFSVRYLIPLISMAYVPILMLRKWS